MVNSVYYESSQNLLFSPFSFSHGRELAVLSGCAKDVTVSAACAAGRHPKEAICTLLGCPGSPYLAAVPQDGWQGILWYAKCISPLVFL